MDPSGGIRLVTAATSPATSWSSCINPASLKARGWGSILAALLELSDICKVYQSGDEELFALDRVSVTIQRGEFVAIMGASGSGKSTLMNIIGALDKATTGRYDLDGVSVSQLNDRRLSKIRNQKIGFVFQAFNLMPRYSAEKNVEVPMVYAGLPSAERRKRARAALERVGLAGRMTHKPTQLSGGQQQRVAIARALVTQPAILLADEPTGALDTDTTVQIMGLLRELHAQGMTIIVVTHEADVAEYAERVLVMRDGKIIEERQHTPGDTQSQRIAMPSE